MRTKKSIPMLHGPSAKSNYTRPLFPVRKACSALDPCTPKPFSTCIACIPPTLSLHVISPLTHPAVVGGGDGVREWASGSEVGGRGDA